MCVDRRGSSGSDSEPNEEEGVEGETSWEWEVAESTLDRMYDEQGICWDPEDAVAYILSRVWRPGHPEHMRTYNCLSMAGNSAWHTDWWIRGGGVVCEGTRTTLEAAERLLAYAVSEEDGDSWGWERKLKSAVWRVDEAKWLQRTDEVADSICMCHAKEGNYARLTRAAVTDTLEDYGMQERDMHAQLVGHVYIGVAVSLARAAAKMCCQRPLEVRRAELALEQVADFLARLDGMCAADRTCDRYLHKAVARVHRLLDVAADMVDIAWPHSVITSARALIRCSGSVTAATRHERPTRLKGSYL